MVEWHPGEAVPGQLGDAFAALYDWFEPRHAMEADDNFWHKTLPDSHEYRWLKMSVERANVETPVVLQRYIDRSLSSGEDRAVRYAVYLCLCAIDRGVAHQLPSASDSSYLGARLSLLRHYLSHYRFNSDATDGYVLPKWTGERFRGSTSSIEDHFVNLVRAQVDRDHVRVLGRAGSRSRRQSRARLENPKIAIVPTLYEFTGHGSGSGEAFFAGLDLGSVPCFKVDHDPAAFEQLRTRVQESVRAIHRSGAAIAVYPELVLNQELLGTLRASLLSESKHKDNQKSNLDWVMAGAGLPTDEGTDWPIKNTCYVLNRYGHLIAAPVKSGASVSWIQEKRYRYKLSRDEQKYYGIIDCFSDYVDREEAISRGQCLHVFEDQGRRFAILICEDLAEERDTLELARKMLCSVLVTIVMDGPVNRYRWHGSRSYEFAARTGALTIVANSLLLPNLEKVRNDQITKGREELYPDGNKLVGLACIPCPGGPPEVKEIAARATPVSGDWESLVSKPWEIPLLRS